MTKTTYAKHFSSIDAVAINLPERKDRHDNIAMRFSDVFKTLSFVTPYKPDTDDYVAFGVDVKKRLVDTRLNHDPRGYFKNSHLYMPVDIDKFSRRKTSLKNSTNAYTPAQYVGVDSLVKTVISICKDFLASDKERIMILEDDAIFASDYDETIDIPDDADIIVWGGAVNGEIDDVYARASSNAPSFKLLNGKMNAWHSQAYELTRKGAKVLSDTFESFPATTLDTGWRYAFDEVTSYSVVPMAFLWDCSKSSLTTKQAIMPQTKTDAKALIDENGGKLTMRKMRKLFEDKQKV